MTSVTQIVHGPWGQKLLIMACTAASDFSQFVPHIVLIYCSSILFPTVSICCRTLIQYIVLIYHFHILFQYMFSHSSFTSHPCSLLMDLQTCVLSSPSSPYSLLSRIPSSPSSPYESNFSFAPPGLRLLYRQWGSPSSWLTSSPPATSTAPCSRVSLCSRICLVFPGKG